MSSSKLLTPDIRAQINRNFIIRLYRGNEKRLIGAGMLSVYITDDKLLPLIGKLLNPKTTNYTYWDRKELTIKFILK